MGVFKAEFKAELKLGSLLCIVGPTHLANLYTKMQSNKKFHTFLRGTIFLKRVMHFICAFFMHRAACFK